MSSSRTEAETNPSWAEAVEQRLRFLCRHRGIRVPAPLAPARFRPFLVACLQGWRAAVDGHSALANLRAEADVLLALALAAIDGEPDDRPINARAAALVDLPGLAGMAAGVPSRVVWLAAMAASVPDEEGAAAVMLVNDLAAIDIEVPLRAWRVATQGP